MAGPAKRNATLQHVLCGECEGIPGDTRAAAAQGCSGIEGIGLDKGVVLVSLSRIVGATTNPG